MSTQAVAFAIRSSAAQFWKEYYPEAYATLKTADTQYASDAGFVVKWSRFPDWSTELVMHEAIDALKLTDFHLVVMGDTAEDIYADGKFDYFKIRVKYSLTFEGDEWWTR